MHFKVRPLVDSDTEWTRRFIINQWGDESVVVHGSSYLSHELSGFVAITGRSKRVGIVTYVIQDSACEIVTINSLIEGEGIGTALVKAIQDISIRNACSRLWCITTNDNLPALRFFQKCGFRIVRVNPSAVERARVIKPSIPLYGLESIPIRDQIELEIQTISAANQ
jgi:ribosomal protein S18 acetylase RimI-like enzyme